MYRKKKLKSVQLKNKNKENVNSSIEDTDVASRLANVNHLLSEEAAAAKAAEEKDGE